MNSILSLISIVASSTNAVLVYLMKRKLDKSLSALAARHEAYLRDCMEQSISRTINAAKNAGMLSRLCDGPCKRIVHSYTLIEGGKVLCTDCARER